MFWAQGGQGLGPWDPGVHLIRSASLGICVLIRIYLRSHSLGFLRSHSLDFLRSHSLGFLRSHSLDFLRSHSLDLVYFCVLGPGGPGPRALGPRGPFNTLRLVGDLRSHS